mmetsp:Transcript_602/g.1707  ORF Transcript_602/g.1707 Transcript_602/m.1707 type:complete len:213 (-) Transcript_602:1017-1655(-)
MAVGSILGLQACWTPCVFNVDDEHTTASIYPEEHTHTHIHMQRAHDDESSTVCNLFHLSTRATRPCDERCTAPCCRHTRIHVCSHAVRLEEDGRQLKIALPMNVEPSVVVESPRRRIFCKSFLRVSSRDRWRSRNLLARTYPEGTTRAKDEAAGVPLGRRRSYSKPLNSSSHFCFWVLCAPRRLRLELHSRVFTDALFVLQVLSSCYVRARI